MIIMAFQSRSKVVARDESADPPVAPVGKIRRDAGDQAVPPPVGPSAARASPFALTRKGRFVP